MLKTPIRFHLGFGLHLGETDEKRVTGEKMHTETLFTFVCDVGGVKVKLCRRGMVPSRSTSMKATLSHSPTMEFRTPITPSLAQATRLPPPRWRRALPDMQQA